MTDLNELINSTGLSLEGIAEGNNIILLGERHHELTWNTLFQSREGVEFMRRPGVVMVVEEFSSEIDAKDYAACVDCPDYLRNLIDAGVTVVGIERDGTTKTRDSILRLRLDMQILEDDEKACARLVSHFLDNLKRSGDYLESSASGEDSFKNIVDKFEMAGDFSSDSIRELGRDLRMAQMLTANPDRSVINEAVARDIARIASNGTTVVAVMGANHFLDFEDDPLHRYPSVTTHLVDHMQGASVLSLTISKNDEDQECRFYPSKSGTNGTLSTNSMIHVPQSALKSTGDELEPINKHAYRQQYVSNARNAQALNAQNNCCCAIL